MSCAGDIRLFSTFSISQPLVCRPVFLFSFYFITHASHLITLVCTNFVTIIFSFSFFFAFPFGLHFKVVFFPSLSFHFRQVEQSPFKNANYNRHYIKNCFRNTQLQSTIKQPCQLRMVHTLKSYKSIKNIIYQWYAIWLIVHFLRCIFYFWKFKKALYDQNDRMMIFLSLFLSFFL